VQLKGELMLIEKECTAIAKRAKTLQRNSRKTTEPPQAQAQLKTYDFVQSNAKRCGDAKADRQIARLMRSAVCATQKEQTALANAIALDKVSRNKWKQRVGGKADREGAASISWKSVHRRLHAEAERLCAADWLRLGVLLDLSESGSQLCLVDAPLFLSVVRERLRVPSAELSDFTVLSLWHKVLDREHTGYVGAGEVIEYLAGGAARIKPKLQRSPVPPGAYAPFTTLPRDQDEDEFGMVMSTVVTKSQTSLRQLYMHQDAPALTMAAT
jgi:hypothetical protein